MMIIDLHPVAIHLDVSLEIYYPMKKFIHPPEKNFGFSPSLLQRFWSLLNVLNLLLNLLNLLNWSKFSNLFNEIIKCIAY